MSRGADDASVTRSLRLTPAGAVLEALARDVAAHVPLDLHDAAPHPSSRTLPGLDLDARGAGRGGRLQGRVVSGRVQLASGATGEAPAPLVLLSADAFREHERLHGRVYREGPCGCGDCLSCEVQRMGRGIGANLAAWPGGAS